MEDILDSANIFLEYTHNLSSEAFTKGSKTIDGVIRNFEIIGEAEIDCRKISRIPIQILTGIAFGDFETESSIIVLALIIR